MIALRSLFALLFVAIAGCGFHLRGYTDIPPWLNNVGISIAHAHRDLGPILREQLESYNISVNPNQADADYLLVIESDAIQQQITNIGASTTPRQYLLVYVTQFMLLQKKGGVIIPSSVVSVSRQLTINNDRILGSNFEEMQLAKEMRRDAAMQIINRLSREKHP